MILGNMSFMYAHVILPLNLKGTFTYEIPEEFRASVFEGCRVLVAFGGTKIYTGLVFGISSTLKEDLCPKPIVSVLDKEPLLRTAHIQFYKWLSAYYQFSLGELYRFAFPSSLKLESETIVRPYAGAQIDWKILDSNEVYLMQALSVQSHISLKEIQAFIPKKHLIQTIRSLIELHYIEIDEKIGERYVPKEVVYLEVNSGIKENLAHVLLNLKRAPKQQQLLLHILQLLEETRATRLKKSHVLKNNDFGQSHLKGLVEKGYIQELLVQIDRIETYDKELQQTPELSPQQQNALASITEGLASKMPVLLDGVTGSGKTHIYMELILDALHQDGNVLFLVPEIALAKQITQRLEKVVGSVLGFYHSKLTDFEKVEVWKKLRLNEIKVLIGTRQALLLPFPSLKLIIVDEEHDQAYRPREHAVNYNTRDAALMMGHMYNASVVLGSATPSLESYYLAQNGKIHYVELAVRYGQGALPSYIVHDYKKALEEKTTQGEFSNQTLKEMEHVVEQDNQVLVLHNRRGFANVVECGACGHVTYCSNCDVVMTYHKASNDLKCHYCGNKAAVPVKCPKCSSVQLITKGIGVEQIYEQVNQLFPQVEVRRMDVDAMRSKFAYEALFESLAQKETQILVGTQMISKGLDFDHIELVVVPRADQLLYVQDFRAEERAYQLLTQVGGRAGRVSGKGKVIIQTFNPTNPFFELLQKQKQHAIYQYLLAERKKFHYPPFTKIVFIELRHRREDKVQRASQYLGSLLQQFFHPATILGPEKSPIGRINLLYQYQIMLKFPRGKSYKKHKELLENAIDAFAQVEAYRSIKTKIIVDF